MPAEEVNEELIPDPEMAPELPVVPEDTRFSSEKPKRPKRRVRIEEREGTHERQPGRGGGGDEKTQKIATPEYTKQRHETARTDGRTAQ